MILNIDGWVFEEGINVLRGPNGSGKTTLLNIIAGIDKPTEGEVKVLGKDPFKDENIRKRIGYVGHQTFLIEDMTGYENIRFFGRFDGDLLSAFGLNDILHKPVRTYSRGERVKLSISIELSRDISLLLLDEPFSSLDGDSREVLAELLIRFSRPVILTAHGDIPRMEFKEFKL